MPFYPVLAHLLHDGGELGPTDLFPAASDVVEMDATAAASLQATGILGLEIPAPTESDPAKKK